MGCYSDTCRRSPDAAYPDFGSQFRRIHESQNFWNLNRSVQSAGWNREEALVHTERWTLFRNVPGGNDDLWIQREIAPLSRAT